MAQGLTRRGLMCGCGCLTAALAFRAQAANAERPPFEFNEIGADVFVHTSWSTLANGAWFPSNGCVIVGVKRVLMIDTAWTEDQTEQLIERLKPIAGARPIDLFITHFHADRMGGIAVTAARGIKSYAFERTVQEARRAKAGKIENALRPDAHVFDLGGRLVEAYYPGPGHTVDNAIAYDVGTHIMFGGCLIRAAATTDLGNTADAVIAEWRLSVARIAERHVKFAAVIPGHGKTGDGALLTHTMKLAGR